MNLAQINSILPLFAAAAYTMLLVSMLLRPRREARVQWFSGFLVASIVWELFLVLLASNRFVPNLPSKALASATLLLGITTALYVDWPQQRRWLIGGSSALLVAFLLDMLPVRPLFSLEGSALLQPTLGGLLSMLIWLGLSATILVKTWRNYQHTRLPWHANRLLHWVVFVFVIFSGEGLLFYDVPWLNIAGQALRFIGVLGLARAVTSHRLFDVRVYLRRTLAFVLIVLLSALPATVVLIATLWVTDRLRLDPATAYLIALLVIAMGFLLYQPFRRLIERAVYRFLLGEEFQTSQIVRNYSKAISRTLDVEQLSLVIIGTISELLETTRGALMLASEDDAEYTIEPIPALGHLSRQAKRFAGGSPFMEMLANEHQPLLQYDVDFSPAYSTMHDDEREWLAKQAMEVYVPVHTDSELTGLIALGPKRSGLPYRPNELELVQVLADQTVVALQNARLYSELNQQHERIRQLNVDLRRQMERLETLDKVKSDFITIASHELRTPLTQVKGYADILMAMNEDASLDQGQTREILSHIERASTRLETLISAMLDASQLEVSGMQLSYMHTGLEAIIQLAIDPMAVAIKNRRLNLELHGLEALPSIYVDFKRLVQAFQNIIGNAIKYTPDYGTISITAELVASADGETDYIEVVVADTGIGIEPQYHDMIFEKFFRIGDPQLHSTGSTKFMGGGPGLGLHIAKGVIEAHGGRIWVEDAPTGGSCFLFELPGIPTFAPLDQPD